MAVQYNPGIVTDGLVLCLDGANRKSQLGSGTGWLDLSGLSNNAILINGATFENTNGGGIACDGVDDYVTITENSSLTPQVISFELAVKINSNVNTTYGGAGTADQYLVFRQNGRTGSFEGYSLGYEETNARFWTFAATSGGTYAGIYSSNNTVTLGRVYLVTCVYDTNRIDLYVNGNLVNTTSKLTGLDYNPLHTLKLGRTIGVSSDWDRAANATFYCFKVYNKALNSSEVSQNFNALRGRFGI